MKLKLLVCSLDSTSYTSFNYAIAHSWGEAERIADEWHSEGVRIEMFSDIDGSLQITYEFADGEFAVVKIFIVNSEERYALVNYHGYDGVEFDMSYPTDDKEVVIGNAKRSADIEARKCGSEVDTFNYVGFTTCVDDGYEWLLWTVVELF